MIQPILIMGGNEMRITLKDIAEKANVSISAVSLVLNDKPCRISQEKKDRIKQIAEEYNYSPNQIARSLVTRQTKTLGLIIPDIENIFFSSLAKNIEEQCRKEGYALIIVNSNDNYRDDIDLLNLLNARSVDGVFMIPSNESYKNNDELVMKLKNLKIPYVMIDRVFPELDCDKVLFDNEYGAYSAVRYLLENGHKKIACISSTESNNGRLRLNGYKKAMEEFKCDIKPNYIIEGDYRLESGYHAGNQLINEDITAVFISNDMMSLGFLKSLYEQNKSVPDDYSVVSYDHSIYPYVFGVELTSVEQNIKVLADNACQLMLGKLKESSTPNEEISLIPTLIKKNSVRNLNEYLDGIPVC